MQDNAFLMNGSSIYERNTGGYQTSYVFHLANPVRFSESIKATIEHGHGNHLANERSSVTYWYQTEPHKKFGIPSVARRKPVARLGEHHTVEWATSTGSATSGSPKLNAEMKRMKRRWAKK